ncbi:MAG: transposase [Planctomycetes bacterium]|nr:transposase [Planctomycetota bacterium]
MLLFTQRSISAFLDLQDMPGCRTVLKVDNQSNAIKVARNEECGQRLRKHQELLLNYFSVKEHLSNSIVESFNLKVKLTMRKSSGFNSLEHRQYR